MEMEIVIMIIIVSDRHPGTLMASQGPMVSSSRCGFDTHYCVQGERSLGELDRFKVDR